MTKILKNIVLNQSATGGQTGTIAEPSLAASGKRMFMTGNWFASRSTDGGGKWDFIDPYTETPPANSGFCCDQLIHYSKKWRLWIWFLQFSSNADGNVVRVAVSSTGKPGSWTWWDTSPQDIDQTWNKLWFDYPDLTETGQYLLLSFNVFSVGADQWKRAVVLRLPMKQLKNRGELERQAWSTDQFGSLRFAKGKSNTAYFASLSYFESSIEIFKWPDNDTVTQTSVDVSDWDDRSYHSTGPDGAPWLNRLDDRITGAWNANGTLGFAWSATADTSHPHPFIRVVRINKDSLSLIDEPDIWSADKAWAYPAMSPNKRGDVGVTAFCGGGKTHPAHAVGWLNSKTGAWDMVIGSVSTNGPHNGVWGDYLDIQADPLRKTYWLASGYVLNGGSTRASIEPRVVLFKP